jgi:hypothetical protein
VLALIILVHAFFFLFPMRLLKRPRFSFGKALKPMPPDQTLTFVTVPKPQKIPDQIEMAKIVLRVWLSYPFTRILMFTNQSEYDPFDKIIPFVWENFGRDRLFFGGNLSKGYEGRPLVRDWFTEGFRLVPSGYICFINGDIIVSPLWMNTAMAVFEAFGESERHRTLIYGTRTDEHRRAGVFDIPQRSPTFVHKLVDWLMANTRCDNPWGMDIVLVYSSFDALKWSELPDFVVGMCVWDNYFMGWANMRANTISMDFGPKIYHVDHPPNACNDENYGYFRGMSARSPHFAGFQEHYDASWLVAIKQQRLRKRWSDEVVPFKRVVDDRIPSGFV